MNSATHNLARRLIALEAKSDQNALELGDEAVRVCERLRGPLAKFLGLDGYRSLLLRALGMAKAESTSLGVAKVNPDGSLEGIGPENSDAAFIILVHLLELLVEFVGEHLTLRLVLDGWPSGVEGETDSSVEEQS